jgi:hypothetical protein
MVGLAEKEGADNNDPDEREEKVYCEAPPCSTLSAASESGSVRSSSSFVTSLSPLSPLSPLPPNWLHSLSHALLWLLSPCPPSSSVSDTTLRRPNMTSGETSNPTGPCGRCLLVDVVAAAAVAVAVVAVFRRVDKVDTVEGAGGGAEEEGGKDETVVVAAGAGEAVSVSMLSSRGGAANCLLVSSGGSPVGLLFGVGEGVEGGTLYTWPSSSDDARLAAGEILLPPMLSDWFSYDLWCGRLLIVLSNEEEPEGCASSATADW